MGGCPRAPQLSRSVRQRQMRRRVTAAVRLGLIPLALAFLIAPVRLALAKVAPATLSNVVAWSDLILVGTVSEISIDPAGHRRATLVVERVWHGAAGTMIQVSLEPTWTCDSADATVGERAVFFLSHGFDKQWHIVHSGHGRMPIVNEQVSVSSMVLLPDETRVRDRGTRQVELQVMDRLVRARVKGQGRSSQHRALPNNALQRTHSRVTPLAEERKRRAPRRAAERER